MAINVEDMSREIMKALNDYRDYCDATLAKDIEAAANLAKDEVQKNAPVDTGAYKKSWKVKKDMKDIRKPAARSTDSHTCLKTGMQNEVAEGCEGMNT